jgi:hypothetical protein
MTDTIAGTPPLASRAHRRMPEFPIGEPVPTAWREDVLTRAKELDSLRAWLLDTVAADPSDPWWAAIREHLTRSSRPPRAGTAAGPGPTACGRR